MVYVLLKFELLCGDVFYDKRQGKPQEAQRARGEQQPRFC